MLSGFEKIIAKKLSLFRFGWPEIIKISRKSQKSKFTPTTDIKKCVSEAPSKKPYLFRKIICQFWRISDFIVIRFYNFTIFTDKNKANPIKIRFILGFEVETTKP